MIGEIGVFLLGIGAVIVAIIIAARYFDSKKKRMPVGRPKGEYDLEAWEKDN